MFFPTVCGLLQHFNREDVKNVNMEAPKLLASNVGNPIVFLPPHFIGQSKSQSQLVVKGRYKLDPSLDERSVEVSLQ